MFFFAILKTPLRIIIHLLLWQILLELSENIFFLCVFNCKKTKNRNPWCLKLAFFFRKTCLHQVVGAMISVPAGRSSNVLGTLVDGRARWSKQTCFFSLEGAGLTWFNDDFFVLECF